MQVDRIESIRELTPAKKTAAQSGSLAKRIVCKLFSRIESGRLVLVDHEEVVEFGQPASEAIVTARVDIHNAETWNQIMSGGVIGAAEAYMLGMWSTPDLTNVIRVMVRNMAMLDQMDSSVNWLQTLLLKLFNLRHSNHLEGSKKNIAAHYDLGNDFFKLFLDDTMMYSSAIYSDKHVDLEAAASHKLDVICQKIDLNETDHVVEIGTGWGGFACHAAKHYGCKVTTTTISERQYIEACRRVHEQGLDDKVTVLFEDYRELQGQYDKLVSIEMIEAVGHEFYSEYFAKCSSLLKPDGKMLIQSILMNDQRYDVAKNSVDFIKRYIFPGGCLPSHTEICQNIKQHTDMQLMAVDDITYDYAKTLADWRERFFEQLPAVREQGYSEEFIKMWEFYLCYCQGGFMERVIHTAQLEFAKPQWRDPRYPSA